MSNAMSNTMCIFPFDDLFDRFFNQFARRVPDKATAQDGPSTPVYYTNDDETEIYVELPGCRKEDVSVEVSEKNSIVVKAKRDVAGKKDSYRLTLTPGRGTFDADGVKPTFVDGILTIPVKEKNPEVRKLLID